MFGERGDHPTLWTPSASACRTSSGVVAAAFGLVGHERVVDVVEVPSDRGDLRDIGIPVIAIGDQAHPDLGLRGRLHDLVDDAPDFLLGAFDQAAHRAGGVDHEDQLDRRLAAGDVFDLCGRIVLGPGGRRREQDRPADEKTLSKTHKSSPDVGRVASRARHALAA